MAVAANPAAQEAMNSWLAGMSGKQKPLIQDKQTDQVQKKGRALTFKELAHDLTGISTLGLAGRRDGQSWGEAIKDDSGVDQTQRAFGGSTVSTRKPMAMQNQAPQLYWGQLLGQQQQGAM